MNPFEEGVGMTAPAPTRPNVHVPGFPLMDPEGEALSPSLNPFARSFKPTTHQIQDDDKETDPAKPNDALEDMTVYNHDAVLVNLIRSQIDYHFSDTNLSMDNYLLSKLHEDPEFWVSISTVASLTKIKQLTDDENIVLRACEASTVVVLNDDKTKIKRPNFTPSKPTSNPDLRRTVFLYGLGPDLTEEHIQIICSDFGAVKKINFQDTVFGPPTSVANVIMTKKFGPRVEIIPTPSSSKPTPKTGPSSSRNSTHDVMPPSPIGHPLGPANPNNLTDFSHLRSCFVIFESQSQANKCVKMRSRAVDGLRAMHLYDFNKTKKKISSAVARGISPVFSPVTRSGVISPPFSPLASSPSSSGKKKYFTFGDAEVVRPDHILRDEKKMQKSGGVEGEIGASAEGGRFPKPSLQFRLSKSTTHRQSGSGANGKEGSGGISTRSSNGRRSQYSQSALPLGRPVSARVVGRNAKPNRFDFRASDSQLQRVVGRQVRSTTNRYDRDWGPVRSSRNSRHSGERGKRSTRNFTPKFTSGQHPPAPTPKFATPSTNVMKNLPSMPRQFEIAAKACENGKLDSKGWMMPTGEGNVAIVHPVDLQS